MKQTVLITGASQGFGFEFAKLFARDGYDLVLIARDKQKLEKVAAELQQDFGSTVLIIPADLAKDSSPSAIFREIQDLKITIDVLVNNAGFATYGKFSETLLTEELEELQVNIVSLTELTKLFLPGMVERGSGRVLNVSSTAAFIPGPLMAVYYASKAYVLSFSEALANEVKGTGVSVTVLCPGPTADTGFSKRAKVANTALFLNSRGTAASVAKTAYVGLMQGKSVVIPGIENKMITTLSRIIPRSLSAQVARKLQ